MNKDFDTELKRAIKNEERELGKGMIAFIVLLFSTGFFSFLFGVGLTVWLISK